MTPPPPIERGSLLDFRSDTPGGDLRLLLGAPKPPDDRPRRALIWATGSLAFTGAALGSVFGALALVRWNEAKDLAQTSCRNPGLYTGCTQEVSEIEIEASSFATVSTFSFLTGGLALAGATILWITGPPQQRGRPAAIQVMPVLAPGSTAGALVQGTF